MAKSADEIKNEREEAETRNSLKELGSSIKAWTSTIASEGVGAIGVGARGIGSGAKDVAKAATDALINELPGAAFLRSSMSDVKGYFTGLKEKARERKERVAEIARQKKQEEQDGQQTEELEEISQGIQSQVNVANEMSNKLDDVRQAILDKDNPQYELLESIEGHLIDSNDIERERLRLERLKGLEDSGSSEEVFNSKVDPNISEKDIESGKGFFGGMMGGGLGGIMKKILNPAKLFLPLALAGIAIMFKDEIMDFVSGDGIVKAFSFIADGIKEMAGKLVSWVKSAGFVDEMFGFVTDILDVVWSVFKGLGKVIWMTIGSFLGKTAEESAAEADGFFDGLGDKIKNIFEFLGNAFDTIVNGIQRAIMGIKKFIVSTYNTFVGAIPGDFIPKLKIDKDGNITKMTDKDKGDALIEEFAATRKPLSEKTDLSGALDTSGIDYANQINAIREDPSLSDEEKQSAILAAYNRSQGIEPIKVQAPKIEQVVQPAPVTDEKKVQQVKQNMEADMMLLWKKINDEERESRSQRVVAVSGPQVNTVNYVQQPDTARRNR